MNPQRHKGRIVVVTGGGSGIGLATATRFAAEGASVTITGRNMNRLESATQRLQDDYGLTVTPYEADVASTDSMQGLARDVVAREGRLDVLVNNAGMASPSTRTDDTEFLENLKERLMVDVIGTAVATAALAPHMSSGGSILNMGSVYATTSAEGSASYSAAKGAVIGLTKTLAVELGPENIRVNCVSPGWVDVPKWDAHFDEMTLRHLRGEFERAPLRSAVTADEIAGVYSFLAHEDALAITGQDIVVDRGMSADLYVTPTLPRGDSSP